MLHVIKLAVGIRDIAHLEDAQRQRAEQAGDMSIRRAYTRNQPVRPEVTDGSLFWVIKGVIRCRQRILGFDSGNDQDGRKFCLFRLDPVLVPVMPTPRGPFQGWRYLKQDDAPPDLTSGQDWSAPSESMMLELRELGLI